ncbi:uncharacterized protein BP5553_05809 [Venustampulla echinocandica]|uniref:Uncharacterized protein n=1 Tax=Venustampulla echinocandica TaxID=2656787 RepID=A0A370TLT0_9HELO|nr:uncharacterized protein BP5553_05809 [Venustampulla echinocandica]RDL36457.1 hypothetical protein BP5553_05809 [Venustampulla echinocandica]
MTGEWKGGEGDDAVADGRDDRNWLPRHELELERLNQNDGDEMGESESDSERERESDYAPHREKRSIKGPLWIFLATSATLTGRRLLRGDFPFYLVFLLQLAAYCSVAVVAVLLQLRRFRRSKQKDEGGKYTVSEILILAVRLSISACFSALAMLCGAKAVMLYNNLYVLVMLPILTYVCDSVVVRFLHLFRISPQANVTAEWKPLWKTFPISLGVWLAVHEDYRLEIRGIYFALASFLFSSLAMAVHKIGPRIEKGPVSWSSPLYIFLGVGIPILFITLRAAIMYEDLVTATNIANSWSGWSCFVNFAPGAILQIIFNSGMNSAYPYISQYYAGGALDDPAIQSQDAVGSTLHTGLLVMIFGVLSKEYNLIDWIQVLALTLVYVVSVGPEHIGYYPPRFIHFLERMTRRKPQPIRSEPWQFPIVLASTTIVFAILMSSNVMFWVDTVAYNRSLKHWVSPPLNVDTVYRPPRLRSFDIIIAHSDGDPIESIRNVISQYTSVPQIAGFRPSIILYTKQPNLDLNLNLADPRSIRGSFEGDIRVKTLNNTGGVTATYLNHIVNSWESFSQQMLFISTTTSPSSTPLDYSIQRLQDYFIPAGFPLPDALRKTGFLHLGSQETCSCETCKDSLGWEDSFHLISSMWSAARPGNSYKCDQVVVTLGNDFLASAARIRGVPLDVWQVLYDGLTRDTIEYSWAHEEAKFPQFLAAQKREGRWDPNGGVYGKPDSLERPWLGFTIERLWAVLLQCSTPEVAWRCPPPGRSWRLGWEKEDCMCIDEAAI